MCWKRGALGYPPLGGDSGRFRWALSPRASALVLHGVARNWAIIPILAVPGRWTIPARPAPHVPGARLWWLTHPEDTLRVLSAVPGTGQPDQPAGGNGGLPCGGSLRQSTGSGEPPCLAIHPMNVLTVYTANATTRPVTMITGTRQAQSMRIGNSPRPFE